MHSFVRSLIEKKKMQGKDPCWDGYQMVGLKKNGDPNCVPVTEAETDNLPGARTHILNKDVRDPDHGIIPNSTVLRHAGDDKYEVRAGRAKGKIISINKQHVNKLDESMVGQAPPKDLNAPKMVQDRKTGEMYDPQKKFRELMNKPETKATMKRLAKEEAEQVDEATGDGAFDKQMKSFKDLSISEGSVELKPSEFHAVRNGNKTIEQIAAEKKKLVGTVRGEINLHADHWSKGEDHYNKTFKEEAKDFSKYTIKPVKTEPKIVRKTNPAGRTTDHAEYEVHGTLSSHKKTFKSKKEAEEYFNTVKEEVVDEATGDKPFDNMMRAIKKGTAKQATADRKEQRKQSQQQARDAFGSSPADKLSIRKPSVAEEQKKGLWANIHAKRKRGERPAKPGEEGYPKTLNIEGVESIDEISADTARSYLDKSKAAKPDLATAAKRFGGSMRAQGVIHRDELKKMSDRLAMQRKSLGLAKESSGECAVCDHTPCNCTRPIVNEVNRDTLHSYMKKANARIEGGHRSLDTQIKSGNAQAANKTAANIQKRMAGTERAEKKLGESTDMKSLKQIIAEAEQKSVHADGIHVKPVKVNGQQKYHVHAVGKNFQSGVKVGEHLSDTELDDFSEMGGRVKHVK